MKPGVEYCIYFPSFSIDKLMGNPEKTIIFGFNDIAQGSTETTPNYNIWVCKDFGNNEFDNVSNNLQELQRAEISDKISNCIKHECCGVFRLSTNRNNVELISACHVISHHEINI